MEFTRCWVNMQAIIDGRYQVSFYENRVLPWMIDLACSPQPIMDLRAEVVPLAYGEVLEVGMGSGLNLALYDPGKVTRVWGLEPSAGMRRKAEKHLAGAAVPVQLLDLPGEEIPLADQSVDCVVLTFTLCTIPDWRKALQQMHRVLKADGLLLFCEHGLAPDAPVQKWQQRLTPLWKTCAGGCHLNRPVLACLAEAGFRVSQSRTFYMDKAPKIAGYMTLGQAVKA